jgi:hypothetical protein
MFTRFFSGDVADVGEQRQIAVTVDTQSGG